ncbi:MAG: hypothetical protein ACKOX6_11920 [Bdellovibrio sp.]
MNFLNPNSSKETFRRHADGITRLIQEDGILFRPYSQPSLPYFSALSEQEQKDVLANITAYNEICHAVFKKNASLKNTQAMIEATLEYYGWTMKPEDFELISEDYLVEIYNQQHTQIFRSFNFFEHSSYTLEDLYCRKWFHLYERDLDKQTIFIEKVHEFQMQKPPQRMRLDLPEQKIQEKDTLERLICFSTLEWLVPVFKGPDMVGLMTLIQVRNGGYS